MKHKSAEEILDERCKENNITFISAYYMQKGLSLPEEGSNDANVFKMAILSAMEAYRFQPSQEVKELPSLEELIKIVFDSNVNILIPDCKGDLEVHIASRAIEIVKQLSSAIITKERAEKEKIESSRVELMVENLKMANEIVKLKSSQDIKELPSGEKNGDYRQVSGKNRLPNNDGRYITWYKPQGLDLSIQLIMANRNKIQFLSKEHNSYDVYWLEPIQPSQGREEDKEENKDMGNGICKEKGCNKFAVIDYNEHGHWVCRLHYDTLSNHFDEEYK